MVVSEAGAAWGPSGGELWNSLVTLGEWRSFQCLYGIWGDFLHGGDLLDGMYSPWIGDPG